MVVKQPPQLAAFHKRQQAVIEQRIEAIRPMLTTFDAEKLSYIESQLAHPELRSRDERHRDDPDGLVMLRVARLDILTRYERRR